jgi:hypothetical protein
VKIRGICTACAGFLMIAVAACDPDVANLDLPESSLILWGRVVNESGAGIAGARVDMSYNPLLCSTSPRKRQDTSTGADGRYREVLETVAEFQGCVRIRVTADGYFPDSAARLDGVFRDIPPFDSVQTVFTLRAR